MADFSGFTEREFDVLEDMFSDLLDELRHFPDKMEPRDLKVFWAMHEQFRNDARTKKIWWAQ